MGARGLSTAVRQHRGGDLRQAILDAAVDAFVSLDGREGSYLITWVIYEAMCDAQRKLAA